MENNEEKIVATLEELAYGFIPDTAVYSDKQEFEEAQEVFKFSQTGKDFFYSQTYNEWLLPQLELNASEAARREREYVGTEKDKIEMLRQDRISADYALKFVKGLVEDAKDFPRPIFKSE